MSLQNSRRRCAIATLVGLLATAPASAQVVNILHSFGGGTTDGQHPDGALTISGSTLYGMTPEGGSGGDGTIFQLSISGTAYSLMHQFSVGVADGANPNGSLLLSGATLYGLTQFGGNMGNNGTFFKIAVDGSGFGIQHSFGGGATDGAEPLGSLTQFGSSIFGMTQQGGGANLGTLFKINPDGTAFNVVHSFAGGTTDGQHPSFSAVTASGPTVYGMTPTGGAFGFGAIFRSNADGTGYTLLHSFNANIGDGWEPSGSLTLSGSTLYGMTSFGGGGAGTIFKINIDGTGYTIMHTFTGQPTGDGANPVGTLTLVGTALYGTTPTGGADALGALFGINTDGTAYDVLHSFAGGLSDGANPGDLTFSGSALYGMTGAGGADNLGTIYSFAPIPEPSSLLLLAAAGSATAILGRRWRRRRS
jgi:uncharacterized repeat protein (TIGR03803 family)